MNKLWKMYFYSYVSFKWAISYLINSFKKKDKPIHILFCLVDHYEPGTGKVNKQVEKERVTELLLKYPKLADQHKDYFGNHPKRTWFFPPHYHRYSNLKHLVSLCENGYGEIELHLHHGKIQPDTPENLERTILQCIKEYGYFGIFGSTNGKKRYGFIHGNWALDNSRNDKYCGVNNEITILKKTGCYADFTFPSMNEASPKKINKIYYAKDNQRKSKSYNKGFDVRRCGKMNGDLLLIQGPLYPFRLGPKLLDIRCFGDAINGSPPMTPKRVDSWIKTGIHIKGKRDWLFIKTHTHGATDSAVVLGEEIENIFNYLEKNYNDGKEYILHYVTARELYNIIKAVEAGELSENPEDYRDYEINPPRYCSSPKIPEASEHLKALVSKTYKG
jgi:hypothetical protein